MQEFAGKPDIGALYALQGASSLKQTTSMQ